MVFSRLYDTGVLPAFFWDARGRIIEGNQGWRALGGGVCQGDEVAERSATLAALLSPEREWALSSRGFLAPHETDYVTANGKRLHLLVGAATIEEPVRRGVAFVIDLTASFRARQIAGQVREALVRSLADDRSDASFSASFEAVLQGFLELTGSEYGFIGEAHKDEHGAPYLRTHAITNIAWDDATRALFDRHRVTGLVFTNLNTLFGKVLTTRAPLVANDAPNDPRAGGLPPGHPPLRAFLGLPIQEGNELLGMIGIANRPGGYDDTVIASLANLCAIAVSLIAAHRNIVRARAAVAALAESEERQRHIADATMDAYYDWNMRTGVVWRNEGYRRLFGSPAELEDTATWWQDRIHPDDRASVRAGMQDAFAHRAASWRAEYRFKKADGEYAHLFDRGLIFYDPAGAPIRFVGSILDLTGLRLAESRLREQASMMSSLARSLIETEQRVHREVADLLHDELQQLLVAAKLKVTSALGEPEDARHLLDEALRLMNDAIAASRGLSTQLSPPILRSADFAAALDWLANWMRKNQELEVTVSGALEADITMEQKETLFAATRELLLNVVKHAAVSRATVRVGTEEKGRVAVVAVYDDGVGFQPTEVHSRHGAGLATIRARVELLGGRLEIVSRPGAGTTARLYVPLVMEPRAPDPVPARRQPALSPPADHAAATRLPRVRVLIADDHALLREALSSLLGSDPAIEVVGTACDGRAALAAAHEKQPDVVIMDVSMPEMDGIEATRALKAELPRVRVVGLSMHEEAGIGARMRAAGARAYVRKDAPGNVLLDAIRAVMRES